ncbi:universal stress protein [Desulfuribacillus stibiiarsenatis]|uniref:Universal stress protein n=1 Tax=Desulfuribacillus stibiiarsenatis TaxID=1390249 RepID=A0A1E5LA34_9FIRM|nr:universal stress protein [Desulfuribacillus stibiiarsenatis]OEH86879.1 universal stress protein [Desulfuribacillus stibiiarsenatis]
MFQNILLAADGSDHSVRAAEHAVRLIADRENAFVTVVYAVDGSTSKYDVLHNKDKIEISIKRKEKLKGVIEILEAANVKYDSKILHGEPGEAIVEFANKNRFDCLVIGSRGLNRLQTMVLGGVSHKVAKGAQCPVMIVK